MKHTRNTTQEEQSSTGKQGWGFDPRVWGKYTADYHRMTEQIAYHCDIRDSCTDPDAKAREQRIIDSCTKRLAELEEKMKQ